MIEIMEKQSYVLANHIYCIKRKNKKIAMHELFDMITGSGTGSIIASGLVMPNDDEATKATQKNKYFADSLLEFFDTFSPEIYHQ